MRIIRFVRDREWVGAVTVLTLGVVWLEDTLEVVSTLLESVPELGSETSISKALIAIVGAYLARRNVTSTATITAGLTE